MKTLVKWVQSKILDYNWPCTPEEELWLPQTKQVSLKQCSNQFYVIYSKSLNSVIFGFKKKSQLVQKCVIEVAVASLLPFAKPRAIANLQHYAKIHIIRGLSVHTYRLSLIIKDLFMWLFWFWSISLPSILFFKKKWFTL